MLIKQNRTIAYTCPACGSTNFESISLFNFSGKSELVLDCKCGKSHISIRTNDYKKYSINIPCIGCDEHHKYILSFYQMWVAPINIIKCKQNGLEISFIGNDNDVRCQQDTFEQKKDAIADKIGFEKEISNPTVMLQTFNRIHDIAEQGNIICECGNKHTSIYMLEDKIILQCTSCGGTEVISAKSSFDLKNTMQRYQIILYKQTQSI